MVPGNLEKFLQWDHAIRFFHLKLLEVKLYSVSQEKFEKSPKNKYDFV